jgi:cytoskeleton protein RodZ
METGSDMCLESFGQYLRNERESRHISLEEFSRKIRVGSCFISALEQNNYGFFSEPRFILWFLKRYALQLGLDPEKVIRRFAVQYELDLQKKPFFENHSDPFSSWKGPKRLREELFLGAIFILVLFFIGFLFLNRPSGLSSLAMLGSKARELQKRVLISAILPSNGAKDFSEGLLSSSLRKIKVVGNRDSKRYHLPGMKYYDKVEGYHRVEFDSEEEAIRAGYHKAPK